MPLPDLQKVTAIIAEVAATEIMPRFRQLAAGDIEMKGINDPVTVADKAAEATLITRLTALLPNSVVVGEEGAATDDTIQARFNSDAYVWVIDPIDGTRNFVEGRPEFGVLIALMRHGQTLAAWIHSPSTGQTLTAERGSGVWLGDHKMRLAEMTNPVPLTGVITTSVNKHINDPDVAGATQPFSIKGKVSCPFVAYPKLFTNTLPFANSTAERINFIVFERKAKPWDHLAGLLMVHELGGISTDWQGRPYTPTVTNAGLIVARDRQTWKQVHTALTPIFNRLVSA